MYIYIYIYLSVIISLSQNRAPPHGKKSSGISLRRQALERWSRKCMCTSWIPEFEMFWWKRFWMTPTWLPKSSKGSFWITRLVNSMCQSWHESTTQQVPSQVVVGIPNSPKLPIQTTHSSFYSALKSSNISNLNYHAAERLWVASWLLIYMKINATSRILTDPNSSLLTEGPTHEPKPRLIHGI